jgi:hypothetical protein
LSERTDQSRGAGAVVAARRNDDTDGRILGANGVEDMGAIIRSIADARSGCIGHLLRQWPEMRGVMDFLFGRIESDDFVTVGGNAGMKRAAESAKISRVSRPFGVLSKHREKPQGMKKILAALAMSLCAATPAHAEKLTDPQTELIVNLAVITASVDRCHFEIDGRIIGLDLLRELMVIEDMPPNGRVHYNVALALRVAANATQGAYDEDPREWCESTWQNYGPDGVTKKGWITRKGAP